jgi:eukaryotic-like serine/threonine-protein kinase
VTSERTPAVREPEVFHARRSAELSGTWNLAGVIDESADLAFLERLSGSVRLNMRGIRRINSYGVRAWIEAVRRVPEGVSLELVECPPSVIDQINMVAGFTGRGKVSSFYAPMICDECGCEKEELFLVEDFRRERRLPAVKCPRCGAGMQVDDLEEQYLLFAREP